MTSSYVTLHFMLKYRTWNSLAIQDYWPTSRVGKCIKHLEFFLAWAMTQLIQKTYQFLNVVNGVSHSHKTANIFFSFDLVAYAWNVYIGLRDAITRQFTWRWFTFENAKFAGSLLQSHVPKVERIGLCAKGLWPGSAPAVANLSTPRGRFA